MPLFWLLHFTQGGNPIWKGWGCSSEILNWTPKGDKSGHGPTIFWPLKETILNFDYMNQVNKMNWKYIIFYISSCAEETLKTKYERRFAQHTLSETKIWNLHPQVRQRASPPLSYGSPTWVILLLFLKVIYGIFVFTGTALIQRFHLSVKLLGRAKDSSYHLIGTTAYNRTRELNCNKVLLNSLCIFFLFNKI